MMNQLDDVQWGKVFAEAWINPAFKASLEDDPSAAIRAYAKTEFGLEVDGSFDDLSIPELPAGMEGECLSLASGQVQGTITGCASASGDVRATVTGCASASGDVRATVTGCASASGN